MAVTSLRRTQPRRWPTWLLLVFLPLVKWSLPAGPLRLLLFLGGGVVLAALAIVREGDAPRVRPLLAAPLRGVYGGLLGYATLVAGATVLLYVPLLQPLLPDALYDLAALFNPLPVYLAVARGDALAPPGTWALMAVGAVAEEWIFRVALLWRWLRPQVGSDAPPAWPAPAAAAAIAAKVLAVSAYFALLHWPQPPAAIGVAFLGGIVAALALVWTRSLALVATLHVLFNLRALL